MSSEVYTAQLVPTINLSVDHTYQREAIPSHIRYIARKYDALAFGRLVVGRRKCGALMIVDGQQRWNAATLLGMPMVPCDVFESNGVAHEAALFKALNKKRKPISPLQTFWVDVETKDETALAILESVRNCGFDIGRNMNSSSNAKAIVAISELLDIWRMGKAPLLEQTIRVASQIWEGREVIHYATLGGVATFIKRVDGPFNVKRLIDKLSKKSHSFMVRMAESLRGGLKRRVAFATAMCEVYNSGAKGKRIGIITDSQIRSSELDEEVNEAALEQNAPN